MFIDENESTFSPKARGNPNFSSEMPESRMGIGVPSPVNDSL